MLTIVYVSFNNPARINDSINSIKAYNQKHGLTYFVVAYKYTAENLEILRNYLSDVDSEIILSNEIRGFSENNNLALKKVKTKFTLILNDDTYVTDNSIDRLIDNAIRYDLKFVSPKILFPNGKIQFLGRPKFNLLGFILNDLKIIGLLRTGKNNNPIFKTFNVTGACFLIESELFKSIGYFNENYFFTPEDIEVSTKTKKFNEFPHVVTDCTVYHIGGSSSSSIYQVIIPVGIQGIYHYLRENNGKSAEIVYRIFVFFMSLSKFSYWKLKRKSDRKSTMIKAWKNAMKNCISTKRSKELFMEYAS